MNKFIRNYNQNRYMVWIVILSIVAIITIIQILDNLAYEKNNTKNKINVINKNNVINYNYSVITGQEVKFNVSEVIDEFISFCNNKQVEEAYEMLSDECKGLLYPSLENFIQNYYSKIFNNKKSYTCQAWISQENIYTYKIDFTDDMLATGSPSTTSIVDYYTIVKNNGEYKLNINKFIGMEDINTKTTNSNITINIKSKKIYMDYEIYDIEVINNTKNKIILADLSSTRNVYIEDSNNKQYFWNSHEVTDNDITIRSGYSQRISIKFKKEYNSNNNTVKIVFANIILSKNEPISIEMEF